MIRELSGLELEDAVNHRPHITKEAKATAFGIKFYSDNGNIFTLPDNNPYMFKQKHVFNPPAGAGNYIDIDLGVSADIPTLVFGHNNGSQGENISYHSYMIKRSNRWFFRVITNTNDSGAYGTWSVYVFTEGDFRNPAPSGWGLCIRDETGKPVVTNNSVPLRLNFAPLSAGDYFLNTTTTPFESAGLGVIVWQYTPTNGRPTYYASLTGKTNSSGYTLQESGGLSTGSAMFPGGTNNFNFHKTAIYINKATYDNV